MAIDGALGYLITRHERPLNDAEQVLSALTSGGISGLLYGNSIRIFFSSIDDVEVLLIC